MKSEKIIGVLELGTLNLKCIISEINENESPKILGTSLVESKGIHNGVIVNLNDASQSIRNCLTEAEKESKITLKNINVVLEPPEFLCTRISKYRKIDKATIQKDDISYLLKEAKNQIALNDSRQSIVHIFNYNYVIDGKEFKSKPLGVHADFFYNDLTIITLPKNILRNINQALINCDIEIGKFISGSFALGVELLTTTNLELGSTIIDIGHEKTSLVIFNNLALVHSATIPIGANHITKDISRGCSLSLDESELIKNELDSINEKDTKNNYSQANDHLSKDFFRSTKFRKISKSLIDSIATARVEEICELLKKEIFFSGLDMTAGKNIFITGGGSNIAYLEKFFSDFFNCDIKRLNIKKNFTSIEKKSEEFNACFGATKLITNGFETEAIAQETYKNGGKYGIFSRIFNTKE